MSWKAVLVDSLLVLTVLVTLVSALGLLLMPNLYDRLHYLGPASTVAPVLLAGAVVVTERFDHQGIVALLLAVVLFAFQPVLSHATARAARIRELGDWHLGPDEKAWRP